MGAATGEKKQSARKALSILKKVAVLIAILDLVLTINDCRNMGRFFLLVTIASTFETTPENVIVDHCLTEKNLEGGICETFSQIVETGRFPFSSEISGKNFHPTTNTNANVNTDSERNSMKETLSVQRLPDMFKEFVMSSKSTFDPSRTEANISFYFDDEKAQRIHEGLKYPHSPQPERSQHQLSPAWHFLQTQSQTVPDKHKELLFQPQSTMKNNSYLNQTRGERDGVKSFSNGNQNSNARELIHNNAEHEPISTSEDNISKASSHLSSSMNQEIGSNREKRFIQPLQIQPAEEKEWRKRGMKKIPASQSNPSQENNQARIRREKTELSEETTPEKVISPASIGTLDLSKSASHTIQGTDHLRNSKNSKAVGGVGKSRCGNYGKNPKHLWEEEGCTEQEDDSRKPGPKKMINFLTQEIFARWHTLLRTAETLMNSKKIGNSSMDEQFKSSEAKRITMHIEIKPFGPDPFKSFDMRLKATQQILFDSPWLTMIQLYYKLSGSFIKMFVVVSLYTWVWSILLALMLLVGSVMGNPTIIHGWIIFNILYSLLFFMIDDWIHTNINPIRTTTAIWLCILYSVYKPLATWLVLLQWSEMKKLVSFDTESRQSLNTTTTKLTPSSSFPSNSSLSTGTTKESTIVDINITEIPPSNAGLGAESNTAAALMLAASKLRFGKSCDNTSMTPNQQQESEEYEEDGEDDCEEEDVEYDDDEVDSESDDEEDERDRRDLEKGESEANNANNDINIRGCGYVVNQ